MAEYNYKDMTNEQGWGMTFDANGRFPIIGNRNGTAIAGVTLGVVADPVADNNGTYEVSFVDTDLVDSDGNIVFWDEANNRSNLKAIKIGDGVEYYAGDGIVINEDIISLGDIDCGEY